MEKLQHGYLFPEIERHELMHLENYPHANIIDLEIGDTTEPLPTIVTSSMIDFVHRLSTTKGYKVYGPEQGEKALRKEIIIKKANIITEYILRILGLDICADTIVANAMFRGISGGQRERVTTGDMLVGLAKALLMDGISTSLDNSTTFQIVNSLKQYVHFLKGTAVSSLLQLASETYNIFYDIILLSYGHIVYHGPCEHVLDFLPSLDFECHEKKSLADFLQVTSLKDQEQYLVHKDQPYRFVTAKEFAKVFKSFHVERNIGNELVAPFDKSKSHPAALGFLKLQKELYCDILKKRLENVCQVGCSITYMYAKCGRLDLAFQILRITPEKASVCWNSMIESFSLNGKPEMAIDLFWQRGGSGTKFRYCPKSATAQRSLLSLQLVKLVVVLRRKMIHRGSVQTAKVLLKWEALPFEYQ